MNDRVAAALLRLAFLYQRGVWSVTRIGIMVVTAEVVGVLGGAPPGVVAIAIAVALVVQLASVAFTPTMEWTPVDQKGLPLKKFPRPTRSTPDKERADGKTTGRQDDTGDVRETG